MPLSHIEHFAFLVPGNYTDEDPARGLEDTLHLFELGERLGYDSAWVRQRHLERGVSSAATFLAADPGTLAVWQGERRRWTWAWSTE